MRDLILDPQNPEYFYASTWNVRRTPYDFSSGGEGSSLWKSNDGGATQKSLIENKGMPKGDIGIIGVTISPVNPNRIWAIIENENEYFAPKTEVIPGRISIVIEVLATSLVLFQNIR